MEIVDVDSPGGLDHRVNVIPGSRGTYVQMSLGTGQTVSEQEVVLWVVDAGAFGEQDDFRVQGYLLLEQGSQVGEENEVTVATMGRRVVVGSWGGEQ